MCTVWKVGWILLLDLRLNCVLCVHQGRVSSDTYLAPQYDPTKTPRIEGMCSVTLVACDRVSFPFEFRSFLKRELS